MSDWGVGGLSAADFHVPEWIPPITREEFRAAGLNILDALPFKKNSVTGDFELATEFIEILDALGFPDDLS